MKKVKIYQRTVKERTGFKKYPFKEVTQCVIIHDNKVYKSSSSVDMDNKRLRIPFDMVLETRSKKELKKYYDRLGRTESDKFKKSVLKKLI